MQNFLERHFNPKKIKLKRVAKIGLQFKKIKYPKLKLLFLTDRVKVSLLTLFADNF